MCVFDVCVCVYVYGQCVCVCVWIRACLLKMAEVSHGVSWMVVMAEMGDIWKV